MVDIGVTITFILTAFVCINPDVKIELNIQVWHVFVPLTTEQQWAFWVALSHNILMSGTGNSYC